MGMNYFYKQGTIPPPPILEEGLMSLRGAEVSVGASTSSAGAGSLINRMNVILSS